MKLGIFDSGLGGLVIAKSIREALPEHDILYFGDTLHLPYGNRSGEAIYEYSKRAIEFLFEQDCALIIVACNTVSASALRKLQQEYLPNSPYAQRRILGVVVPTLETAADAGYERIGLIATNYTIRSKIYEEELQKLNPALELTVCNAPLLVPLIENEGAQWLEPVLEHYLKAFDHKDVQSLILGCTHYASIKSEISELLGDDIDLLSQDEIIPAKLLDYLQRHPEIDGDITKTGNARFIVSDITPGYINAAQDIYGEDIHIEKAHLSLQTNTYTLETD